MPPFIPVGFYYVHERKLESSHDEFIKFISTKFKTLSQSDDPIKFTLVADEKQATRSTIDKWVPGFICLCCWNHTLSAVRFWLKKKGAKSQEFPVYTEDLWSLFHIISIEEYQSGLEELKVINFTHTSTVTSI